MSVTFEEMFIQRILEDEAEHLQQQRELLAKVFNCIFGFEPEITDYKRSGRYKFLVGKFWLYTRREEGADHLWSDFGQVVRPMDLAPCLQHANV